MIGRRDTASLGRTRGIRPEWVAASLVLVLVLAVLALAWWRSQPKADPSPLPVRLLGVRPNAQDLVFSPAGRLVEESIYDGPNLKPWAADTMRRDFIFKLDRSADQILSVVVDYVPLHDAKYRFSTSAEIQSLTDGRTRLVAKGDVPRTLLTTWQFLKPRRRPVRKVDLHLYCYDRSAAATMPAFAGPFAPGQTHTLADGTRLQQLAENPDPLAFELISSPLPDVRHPPYVLVLDSQGQRRSLRRLAHTASTNHHTISFAIEGRDPEEIASIQLIPVQEAHFRNVRVNVGSEPAHPHPPILDALAGALGWTNPPALLASHRFSSPAEVWRTLPLLRGPLIRQGWQVLQQQASQQPLLDEADPLHGANPVEVRDVARRWTEAHHPAVRAAGVGLGLLGRWREFVDPAIELLTQIGASTGWEMAPWLARHHDLLEDQHWARLAEWALDTKRRPEEIRRTLPIFSNGTHPNAHATLRRLAEHEMPSVWWPLLKSRPVAEWAEGGPVSSRLRQRLWQVHGEPSLLDREDLKAAQQSLGSLLTRHLWNQERSLFLQIYQAMRTRLPTEDASRVTARFLVENPQPETIHGLAVRMIRDLNRWNNLNLAGWGRTPDEPIPPKLDPSAWEGLRQELRARWPSPPP